MPANDYTPVTSGALKLKGVTPSAKISKQKHKKKKRPEEQPVKSGTSSDANAVAQAEANDDPITTLKSAEEDNGAEGNDKRAEEADLGGEKQEEEEQLRAGKTEAELRHEERRRKRLDERLKREGTKTHKQRVEELNRYLSNLSEHHDMPRIGPG